MSPPSPDSVSRSQRLRIFESILHAGDRCACCLYTFSPIKTIVRVGCNRSIVRNLLRILRLDELEDWKVQQKDITDEIKLTLCDGCQRSLDDYGELGEKIRKNYDHYEQANQKRSGSRNAGSISGGNTDASRRRESVESSRNDGYGNQNIESQAQNESANHNKNERATLKDISSSPRQDYAKLQQAEQEVDLEIVETKYTVFPTSDKTNIQESSLNISKENRCSLENSCENIIKKPKKVIGLDIRNFVKKQNNESRDDNNEHTKRSKNIHHSQKREKSHKHGNKDERRTKTEKDDGNNKKGEPNKKVQNKSFAASTKESIVQQNKNSNKIKNKNVSVARKDENILSIPENNLASCKSAKVKNSEYLKEVKERTLSLAINKNSNSDNINFISNKDENYSKTTSSEDNNKTTYNVERVRGSVTLSEENIKNGKISNIITNNTEKDESSSKNASSEDNIGISNIVRSEPSSSTIHDLNHSKPNTTRSENINVNVNRDELCSKNTSSENNIITSIIVGSKQCSFARQDFHSITPIATNENINAIKRDGKRTLTENSYEENAKKARVKHDRSIIVTSDILIARRASQDNAGPSSQAGRTNQTPIRQSIVEYIISSSDEDSDDDTVQTQTKWIATVRKDENEDTMELPIHDNNDCELINDEEIRPITVKEKEIDEDLMNKVSEQVVEFKTEVLSDGITGCIDLDEISLSDSNIRRDIEILPDDEPHPDQGLEIEHHSSSIQHRNQETPSCLETRTLQPFPLSPTTLEPPEPSTQVFTMATQLPMMPTQLPILISPSNSTRLPTIIAQPSTSSTTAHLDYSGGTSHSDQPSGSAAVLAVPSAPLFPPIRRQTLRYGTIRGQEIYIGFKVWISLSSYKDAENSKTSSAFIRKMLEAIWTIEVLGRMESKQPLDEKKTKAVKMAFEKWVRKRIPRRKSKERNDEIKRFRKLVNDAKSMCRKKIRKLNDIPPG